MSRYGSNEKATTKNTNGNEGHEASLVDTKTAVVGVSDHGGWAVCVTVGPDRSLLDRRLVELVDADLPKMPHHVEGQRISMRDAVALVNRVRASAEKHAATALEAIAADVPQISGIALRALQKIPDTIADRLTDTRAKNVADWVMYRVAIAKAAEDRRWTVHWFDPKAVIDEAAIAMRVKDMDRYFSDIRKRVGPPWNADHKIAMSAAIVASR